MNTSIIGLGRIAFSLETDPKRYKPCTHLGALKTFHRTEYTIQGLCDLNSEKCENAARFLNCGSVFTSQNFVEILSRNPELLLILTSTESHFEILQMAMDMQIPRIVVEKPVCLTKKEANNLMRIRKKSKSKVWVNYERQYHKKYKLLKKMIQTATELGPPLYYNATMLCPGKNLTPFEKDEGILLHDTTHMVDLACFLFGPAKDFRKENVFKNNKKSILHLNHSSIAGKILTIAESKNFLFEMEIFFEKGRVRTGNGYSLIEKSAESPYYSGFYSYQKPEFYQDNIPEQEDNPFRKLYEDVLFGNPPENMFENACENVKILS